MADEIDLGFLKSHGLSAEEELMDETENQKSMLFNELFSFISLLSYY